jgi:hypothetical protein
MPTFARIRVLFTGDQIEDVVVGVGAAEAGCGADEPQPPRDLVAVVGGRRPPQQISGAEAEAAAVDEQVAHGQLARDVRIPHLKPRQVSHHRRVPLDLLLLDEQPESGGGKQLGVRSDPEQRLRVGFGRVAKLANAVALGDYHLTVLDDRQRHTRHLEGLHHALDVRVEIGRRRSARLGMRADAERQQQHEQKHRSRRSIDHDVAIIAVDQRIGSAATPVLVIRTG